MFVDLEDLVRRVGNDRVLQLLDHDDDGVADEKLSQEVLADADAEAMSIIVGKGFTREQARLMGDDPLIRRAATMIALGYAGETKQEFLDNEGKGPYDAVANRGREALKQLAVGERRAPRGEASHGENATLVGEVFEPEPKTYFLPRPDRPRGPGGF